MFTGLVESVGKIKMIKPHENYLIMKVSHALGGDEIKIGDSISCDGACLTVVSLGKNVFTFEISQETISKTIAAEYNKGQIVNLERAVRVGDRLGGHFVTGHIDAVGQITKKTQVGESIAIEIGFDDSFDNLVVSKGSIAINGVSLTVNEASSGRCTVNLIPHTLEQTTFENLNLNDKVNIEFDLIGKYALKAQFSDSEDTITHSKLMESGW